MGVRWYFPTLLMRDRFLWPAIVIEETIRSFSVQVTVISAEALPSATAALQRQVPIERYTGYRA